MTIWTEKQFFISWFTYEFDNIYDNKNNRNPNISGLECEKAEQNYDTILYFWLYLYLWSCQMKMFQQFQLPELIQKQKMNSINLFRTEVEHCFWSWYMIICSSLQTCFPHNPFNFNRLWSRILLMRIYILNFFILVLSNCSITEIKTA